jgi:AAA domain
MTEDNPEGKLCRIIYESDGRYDFSEVNEMLEMYSDQQLLRPKPKENGAERPLGGTGFKSDGPVDVDGALANMEFGGGEQRGIHWTQLRTTGALINAGKTVEEATDIVLAATRAAVANNPNCAKWNWEREESEIRWMCLDLITKAMRKNGEDLGSALPAELQTGWEAALAAGKRPAVSRNSSGIHVRSYPWHRNGDAANDNGAATNDNGGAVEEETPERPQPKSKTPGGIRVLTSAEFITDFVPPDYLIDGVLQRRFLYSTTAMTGHGKTAVALYMAYAVAKGDSFGVHEVERGSVCYLAGENPDDVRMRWMAMSEQLEFDIKTIDVHFVPGRFPIKAIKAAVEAKAKETGREFSLVIVDTSAAYFPGNEENSNAQLGDHARTLRTLIDLPGGPTVMVTCHPTKNPDPDNLLPRGGGAFLNEMDGNLVGTKVDSTFTLHWHGKFRGVDFDPIAFELVTVTADCLKDSKGRNIPSIMARPLSEEQCADIRSKAREDEDEVLKVVLDAGDTPLSLTQIAVRAGWITEKGFQKARAQRAVNRLIAAHLLKRERDELRLTEAGKKAAQKLVQQKSWAADR